MPPEVAEKRINVRTPEGDVRSIPESMLDQALIEGFTVETQADRLGRLTEQAREEDFGGIGGGIGAAGAGLARGATFGLSDVVRRVGGADPIEMREQKAQNPTISTISEVTGAVVPTLLTGGTGAVGTAARLTPAGATSRLALGVTERVAGQAPSAARYVAGAVAGGATEGAIQNVGSYISDVALQNKELSAEGVLGSAVKGGAFGGLAGGAFGGIEKGTIAARRLFPRSEAGERTVQAAEQEFVAKADDVSRAGDELARTAQQRLDELALRRAELNLEKLKLKGDPNAAERIAQIRVEQAQLTVARRAASGELAAERAAKAGVDPTSVAPLAPDAPAVATDAIPAPAPAPSIAPSLGGGVDDLEAQLAGTLQQLDQGVPFTQIGPDPVDAIDDAIRANDGEAARLADKLERFKQGKPMADDFMARYGKGAKSKYSATGAGGTRGGGAGPVRTDRTRLLPDEEVEASINDRVFAGIGEARAPSAAAGTRTFDAGGKKLRMEATVKKLPNGGEELHVTSYRTLGDGEEVESATASFAMRDGELYPNNVTVEPALQRKGVASEMYDLAERHTGRKIIPSATQTPEGKALSESFRSKRGGDAAEIPFEQRVNDAFVELEGGNRATVLIGDLRSRFPDMPRAEFDKAFNDLRRKRFFSMEASHKPIPAEQLEAGMREGGQSLVYVSRGSDWKSTKPRTPGFKDIEHAETDDFGRSFGQLDDEASAEAIRKWQDSPAVQRNARSRGLIDEDLTGQREQLERVIASGRLPRDVRLYRGAGANFDSSHLKPGSTMSSEGLLATSTNRGVAESFATLDPPKRGIAGTVFEIDAPAGSPSAWASSRPGEREVLFGRRTELRIKSVRTEDVDGETIRVVHATIDPPAPVSSMSGAELDDAYEAAVERAAMAPNRAAQERALREAADLEDQIFDTVAARGGRDAADVEKIRTKRGDLGQDSYTVAVRRAEKRAMAEEGDLLSAKARAERDDIEAFDRGMRERQFAGGKTAGEVAAELRKPLAERILGAAPEAAPKPSAVNQFIDDADEAIRVVGEMEKATAELAKELGDMTPPKAKAVADGYWAAVDDQARKTAAATAMSADDAVRAGSVMSLPKPPPVPASEARRIGKGVADAAAVLDTIQTFGDIPGMPNPRDIPVIGPILSMYLKVRAGRMALKRIGGRIPATAEAKVAAKSAELRDRAAAVVDRILVGASKTARVARQPAVAAGTKLMDSLSESLYPQEGKRRETPKTAVDAAKARVEELTAAVNDPDGVRAVVRGAIQVSDPDLATAIEAATMRKLEYLHKNAPKLPAPGLLATRAWAPSKVEIEKFARRIRATSDPVSVLDDLEAGTLTTEAAEALRVVYPSLFSEVQMRLIDRAAELEVEVPYKRRLTLSALFDVPLDDSLQPARLLQLQQIYTSGGASPDAAGAAPGGPQPPVPSVAAPIRISTLYDEQRRSPRR
jgi:hypothetical protein